MTTALRVEGLAKSYGAQPALEGVSFAVESGELLALLGPNGAGKTTLIRAICGRVRVDAGTIELLGRTLPARGGREALGFVPQELGVYPDLTTRENLRAFGVFNGLRGGRLRERIDWALEWTGLEDRADDLPRTFSGGMKRRVNLACGVLHSPRVLLLDEPTVGVDPQSRARIFAMIRSLRDEGTAIVLTTHHLEEAEREADRIVIVDAGRVIADGTLTELIDQTIGADRRATLRFSKPLANGAAGMVASLVPGVDRAVGGDPLVWSARLRNVAAELPRVLDAVASAGGDLRDLEVHAPDLQAVFLHLTGRELRE
ncbi:MAG: ABC transporter ATP-binding protein [Lacipirellulaceae bacterium]